MSVSVFTSVFMKYCSSLINKIELQNQIEAIYLTMYGIYDNISKSSFESAKQCIRSLQGGLNYNAKILDAISHLRLSYNISKNIFYQTRKVKFLMFTIDDSQWVVFDPDKRLAIRKSLAEIAALIAFLYHTIGESQNFTEWKNIAVKDYEYTLDSKEIYNAYYYKNSHPQYVKEAYRDGGYIGDGFYGREKYYEFTDLGHEYINKLIKEDVAEFVRAITNKKLL